MFVQDWLLDPKLGFLSPEPLTHLCHTQTPLPETLIDPLEDLAAHLPNLLVSGEFRQAAAALPDVSLAGMVLDQPTMERLFMLYGFFASAYIHTPPAADRLPAQIAVPLTYLADQMGRPPMLAYAGMILNNWCGQPEDDPAMLPGTPDNVRILQTFTGLPDESWFYAVHVAIEARAGAALHALRDAIDATDAEYNRGIQRAFREIQTGLVDMTRLLHRMPDGCDPDTYYRVIRPYLHGFNDVTYDGVLNAEPQTWQGGSGAQSSIVPALLAGLGVRHSQTDLTTHLTRLQRYMPIAHRHFIEEMHTSRLREYVSQRPYLADAYNNTLRRLMTFRRAHLYYARTYIFARSTTATGTGGTPFMQFLSQLINETDAHLL